MTYIKKISLRLRIIAGLALIDLCFFGLINPNVGNSLIIILGCVFAAATVYCLCLIMASVLGMLAGTSLTAQRRIAIFLATVAIFLLLMQSIGQLSIRDIIAIVPLAALLYLYSTYAMSRKKTRTS